jgi:methylated-DNA-[protein]-cysteine S-methyltransferase
MPVRFFPTALGLAAIECSEHGLTRFHLPTERPEPGLPDSAHAPAWIEDVVARAREHFAGCLHDFDDVALDWTRVTPFQERVYVATRAVRAGCTTTYGAIARALGLGPEGSRSVGVAEGSNPWPLIVPCHRVIAANGNMTGFSAPGGISLKTRLLALERAELPLA